MPPFCDRVANDCARERGRTCFAAVEQPCVRPKVAAPGTPRFLSAPVPELSQSIKTSDQDRSLLRAMWWRTKARVLGAVSDGQVDRRYALNQALALYAALAPRSNTYAEALNMASRDDTERGGHLQARELTEKALAVAEAASDRDDAFIGVLLTNLSRKQESLGEFEAADATYQRAETQVRRSVGERHSTFWITRAYHARLLHRRGQRERANTLFEQMLQSKRGGGAAPQLLDDSSCPGSRFKI
jgi:tetratricopeptide (TPR) repeat protein